jgi:2-keto-4-pentenoate hydratase
VERARSLDDIAREVKVAQDLSRQIQPITARMDGFDDDAGYEVAHLIHEARVAEGAVPVGRKIGFTNREIWPARWRATASCVSGDMASTCWAAPWRPWRT